MKGDLLLFWVNKEVAIGMAYRTVAGSDSVLHQRMDMYDVSHSTAVTACLVRSELPLCEGQVRDQWDLGCLVFQWYLLPVSINDFKLFKLMSLII